MRVLMDATALGSGRGGDETYLTGLLSGLAAVAGEEDSFPLFVRPQVALPPPLGTGRFPAEALRCCDGAGRLVLDLPAGIARHAHSSRPPDLVHSITHHPLWGGVPHALTVTDLSFLHHPEFYERASRIRLNTLVPRQARRARVVLTISEFCRADLVEHYGLEPERVFVVPCAIAPAPPCDRDPQERALRVTTLGVRQPFVLYLGNLHPRKNVARLIRAFGAALAQPGMAGHQLVIAGARWWGDGAEQQEAAALPEGSVVFLGRVSDEARDDLLRSAVALAYPSVFEGFGLPPLEAMAVGTPVIAGRTSAIPEVLGDAALLVDPFDVDAIADALLRLAGSEALRADLAARGYTRVGHYPRERTGQAAMAAFAWALAHGGVLARTGALS